MSTRSDDFDVLELAREWAAAEGLDADEWTDEDFLEYFYNEVGWEPVVEVHWRDGRFAGVKHHGGVFLAYDQSETHGPFRTFVEAHARLGLEEDDAGIARYHASPLFERKT